uniref:F-box only protein 48-like n=1 Tax=Saccoglossus kowalevskii TaxID=10224 RepID=A0ABM0MX71_SACKO|nr:PREDICTED: F-box only protein 48-like [Saccoglossus kowalevskii]
MAVPVDIMDVLPMEICMEIALKMDASTLCYMSQTCKSWNNAIGNTEWLWRLLCLKLIDDQMYVQKDRLQGFSWKNTFIRNYGYNAIKRHWLDGTYSNINSYHDLPTKCMCPMDLETWGQVLELELCR